MQKLLITFCIALGSVSIPLSFGDNDPPLAAPTLPSPRPPYRPTPFSRSSIVEQQNDINADGSYKWRYETADGIKAEEEGHPFPPDGSIAVSGNFQYTAPDNTPIALSYIADENGFQPIGDHIPKIPPLIARALEWIQTHPEKS